MKGPHPKISLRPSEDQFGILGELPRETGDGSGQLLCSLRGVCGSSIGRLRLNLAGGLAHDPGDPWYAVTTTPLGWS